MGTRLLLSMGVVTVLLAGCKEGPIDPEADDAPPIGSVDGVVRVEGEPLPGVTVSLLGASPNQTTSRTDGSFVFPQVYIGEHSVSLAGLPPEVHFETALKAIAVSEGITSSVTFEGTWVRNAVIRGTVTVDGAPRAGVTIRLSGEVTRTTTTDGNGEYVFEGLLPSTFEVALANLLEDGVVWIPQSQLASPGFGETVVADFEGYRPIGEIRGQVGVGNDEPLAGVRVVITHTGTGETHETLTDQGGAYRFDELRLGVWRVQIVDGWDDSLIIFDETSDDLDLTLADPDQVRVFRGRYRPGSVTGGVTLDGAPAGGVTLQLVDALSQTTTVTTDGAGSYVFAEVAPGEGTVSILGDGLACEDEPRALEVAPATEVVADFTCVTPPPSNLTFDLAEAEGPDEYLVAGAVVTAPIRDETGAHMGEVTMTMGAAGYYYRASDRLWIDAPGSVRMHYDLTSAFFAAYTLGTIQLTDIVGIGASCVLDLALLDSTGAVLTAVTFATLADTLEIGLVPGAVELYLAFRALTPAGCAGAYIGIGSGGLELAP